MPPSPPLPQRGEGGAALLPDRPPLPALTNIGTRPTFTAGQDAPAPSVETWIQDWEGDLYDQRVTIQVLDYIRPERRFAGPNELIAAIRADQEALQAYVAAGREPFC